MSACQYPGCNDQAETLCDAHRIMREEYDAGTAEITSEHQRYLAERAAYASGRIQVYVTSAEPGFEIIRKSLRKTLVALAVSLGSTVKWEPSE